MNAKRSAIVLLAGLNVFLFLAMLTAIGERSVAYGQAPGARPGSSAMVTAKVASQTYEVLYWLDAPQRKLHAFYPGNAPRSQRMAAPPRDLEQDFTRK